jgi:hypothetical protein
LKMSGTGEAWANAKQERPEKTRGARRPAPLADILRRRVFPISSTFRWDMVEFRTMALGGQESFSSENENENDITLDGILSKLK